MQRRRVPRQFIPLRVLRRWSPSVTSLHYSTRLLVANRDSTSPTPSRASWPRPGSRSSIARSRPLTATRSQNVDSRHKGRGARPDDLLRNGVVGSRPGPVRALSQSGAPAVSGTGWSLPPLTPTPRTDLFEFASASAGCSTTTTDAPADAQRTILPRSSNSLAGPEPGRSFALWRRRSRSPNRPRVTPELETR
jgi:hypothetical protein